MSVGFVRLCQHVWTAVGFVALLWARISWTAGRRGAALFMPALMVPEESSLRITWTALRRLRGAFSFCFDGTRRLVVVDQLDGTAPLARRFFFLL